jgi:hypothetical protein
VTANAGTFSTDTAISSGDAFVINSSAASSAAGAFGAGLIFTGVGSSGRRAAIVPVQGTADNDTLGLAFFTHGSSTGSNPLAEAMRITSGGALLVGRITDLESARLAVQGAANTTAVAFYRPSTGATSTVFRVHSDFGSVEQTHFQVLVNGDARNTNNSYGAISDVKLKENIVDATPKLDKLNQVRVVNYNLKNIPEQKLLGVVAQELEQIFPGMVDESTDTDKDGNELGTTTKSVKYSVFVPMLIKAIQEQQEQIQELKTEIDSLKNQSK